MNTGRLRHVALRGMGASPGCRNQQSFPHPVLATDSVRFVRSEGKKRSKAVSATEKRHRKVVDSNLLNHRMCMCVCGVLMEKSTANKRLKTQLVSVERRLSKWSFTFAIECCSAWGWSFCSVRKISSYWSMH